MFDAAASPSVLRVAILVLQAVSSSTAKPLGTTEALPSAPDVPGEQAITLKPRAEQQNAGWGLSCLSESEPSGDGHPNDGVYRYLEDSGAGADVYVVDTGINDVGDFGTPSRILGGKDYTDTGLQDTDGHGTSMAALVGSDKFGAAKKPNIWNYKTGTVGTELDTDLIWNAVGDIQAADQGRQHRDGYRGAVILMSLSFQGVDADFEEKLREAYDSGITFVAAAGNLDDPEDASTWYPCAFDFVICVGSIDEDYKLSYFTNYGPVLGILAPGGKVQTYNQMGNEIDFNGASASAAYVAGVVAIFKGYEGPAANHRRIESLLDQNAQRGILQGDLKGTVNLLANTGYQKHIPYVDAPDQPAEDAPIAATTPAPSCSITQFADATIGGQFYPASSQCACDDSALGGLDTVTGTSGTSYLRCGVSTDLYLSTFPPTTTPDPTTSPDPTTRSDPTTTSFHTTTSCSPIAGNGIVMIPNCVTNTIPVSTK